MSNVVSSYFDVRGRAMPVVKMSENRSPLTVTGFDFKTVTNPTQLTNRCTYSFTAGVHASVRINILRFNNDFWRGRRMFPASCCRCISVE